MKSIPTKNQRFFGGENKTNKIEIRYGTVDDTVIGFVIAFVPNEKVLAITTTHRFHSYW